MSPPVPFTFAIQMPLKDSTPHNHHRYRYRSTYACHPVIGGEYPCRRRCHYVYCRTADDSYTRGATRHTSREDGGSGRLTQGHISKSGRQMQTTLIAGLSTSTCTEIMRRQLCARMHAQSRAARFIHASLNLFTFNAAAVRVCIVITIDDSNDKFRVQRWLVVVHQGRDRSMSWHGGISMWPCDQWWLDEEVRRSVHIYLRRVLCWYDNIGV